MVILVLLIAPTGCDSATSLPDVGLSTSSTVRPSTSSSAGVSASPSATLSASSAVNLNVTPSTSLYDTPFVSTVTGLSAGQQATLRMTSTAQDGAVWSSQATFRAGPDGRFDTTAAPVDGAYGSADPMGLVETLTPGHSAIFHWASPWTMTETVQVNGTTVASAVLTRRTPAEVGVRRTALRPPSGGVYGEMFSPYTAGARPGPAVVVFGGSEGGLSVATLEAGILASHGYPALALAYFGEPGLPATLNLVPLEYFATAARLLAGQPGVDGKRIVLWGASRGAEAALLAAAHFPTVIRAVIAGAPGAEAVAGIPSASTAAWTLAGRPVPTAPAGEFDRQSATSAATIPVENISGPILLVCGGQDEVWRSCANSAVIDARLAAHHRPAATLLRYPQAGHYVDFGVPYLPGTASTSIGADGRVISGGGTFQADQAARADSWPRVLSLLTALKS